MSTSLEHYLEKIRNDEKNPPAIVDEKTALYALNTVFQTDEPSLESFKNAWHHEAFFYGIEAEKKEFSIKTIREFSADISLKPYQGNHFFILEDFDTASISAQNAILKILEDSPSYAKILLVVKELSPLLPTIFSRSVTFFEGNISKEIDDEVKKLLNEFCDGENADWFAYLYHHDFSREMAIQILAYVYKKMPVDSKILAQKYIKFLSTTNEKPKNILESYFFSQKNPEKK